MVKAFQQTWNKKEVSKAGTARSSFFVGGIDLLLMVRHNINNIKGVKNE